MGKGTPLGEALESLVHGFDTSGPVKVRGLTGVSEGVLHTIQDDFTNTAGEHWGDKVRIWVFRTAGWTTHC